MEIEIYSLIHGWAFALMIWKVPASPMVTIELTIYRRTLHIAMFRPKRVS